MWCQGDGVVVTFFNPADLWCQGDGVVVTFFNPADLE